MLHTLNPHDVRLFCGRSNPKLAQEIADRLGIPLEPTKIAHFSNDNLMVQLGASVRGRVVYIMQSLTPPVHDHLMELLMMLDIAKQGAAREVHAIIPYFSYARSDKKDAARVSITARLVADLLETAGATQVMAMTLHSPQVHGFFSVPMDPLTCRKELISYLSTRNLDPKTCIMVAPDAGRAKSTARVARALGLPAAIASKVRLSDTDVEISNSLIRQIAGFKHAIIYDDEIATAGTITEVAQVLVENGVEKLSLVCTHGLFKGPAIERLTAIPEIAEIISTDTVPPPPEGALPNLTVLSSASVIGEAIRRNYYQESLGSLFSYGANDEW